MVVVLQEIVVTRLVDPEAVFKSLRDYLLIVVLLED
jgi:hypothetical protein